MKYEQKKIKDICRFIGGSQPPKSEFVYEPIDGYVRLIQTRDRLNDDFITFIPRNSTTKFCEASDILIGRYGPPIFQIFRGFEGAYNVAIMKADPINGVNKDYLYYFLLQNSVLKYVDSMSARTGGQTGVELDSLYEYPVLLPDATGQEKISGVLKSIDNKIKNNEKINIELEAIATTLYDYWFTQFDFPNANGKPYRSSGGKMEWNDQLKCKIPRGWRVGSLANLGTITSGGTPATDNSMYYSNEGIAWITPNDLSGNAHLMYFSHGSRDITEAGLKNSSAVLMPKGTVLFSSRAPIGYIAIAENEVSSNQGFKSIVPKKGYGSHFVYYTLKRNTQAIAQQGVGTTFKEVSRDTMERFLVILPPEEIVEKFETILKASFEKRRVLEHENRELVKLRDWLLPMLMNGQATFCDSEQNVVDISVKHQPEQQFAVRQAARIYGDTKPDDTADLIKAYLKRKENES